MKFFATKTKHRQCGLGYFRSLGPKAICIIARGYGVYQERFGQQQYPKDGSNTTAGTAGTPHVGTLLRPRLTAGSMPRTI